jgi:hypothetical protein
MDARGTLWGQLTVAGRFALFDSDTGESRCYAYEAGLRNEFTIPSFSWQGDRWYVLLEWEPSNIVEITVKFATTTWPERSTTGSGLDEVAGNRIRSVGAEITIRI